MSNNTKSPAKQMMINFIKSTREEPEFTFKIRGDTDDAKAFIHRMRVELSRMRDAVIQSGKMPKEFKVLVHNLHFDADTGITHITLLKAYGTTVQIAEDVAEIFNDISGGDRIQS